MQRLILSLLPVAAAVLWVGAYAADMHGHDHGHDQHTQQALHLDNGKKWQTDASLRAGMEGIRASVERHRHGAEHAPAQEYGELARAIQGNIDQIVQGCKLEPQADAVLHVLLGELFEGMALLEGKKGDAARPEGVERVLHTLANYSRYFDHPGWELSHH